MDRAFFLSYLRLLNVFIVTASRACMWSVQHFRLTTTVTVSNTSRLEEQLSDQRKQQRPITTTDAGIPAPSDEYSLTVGPDGPVLLQDNYLMQRMAQLNGERLPEPLVHAKATP